MNSACDVVSYMCFQVFILIRGRQASKQACNLTTKLHTTKDGRNANAGHDRQAAGGNGCCGGGDGGDHSSSAVVAVEERCSQFILYRSCFASYAHLFECLFQLCMHPFHENTIPFCHNFLFSATCHCSNAKPLL